MMGSGNLSLSRVQQGFDQLPEQQQMALDLIARKKYSLHEISDSLEVSPAQAVEIIMDGFARLSQDACEPLTGEHSAIAHAHDAGKNPSTLRSFVDSLVYE